MNNSIDMINEDAAKACAKPIAKPAGYSFDNWYEEVGQYMRYEDDNYSECKDCVKLC